MESKFRKVLAISGLSFAIIVILLGGCLLIFLANVIMGTAIPFDNDEAQHAIDGWEVYLALKNGSWEQFDWAIRNQAFYPPVNSLALQIGYLFLGPDVAAGRLISLAFFAGSILVVGFLTYRLSLEFHRRGNRTGANANDGDGKRENKAGAGQKAESQPGKPRADRNKNVDQLRAAALVGAAFSMLLMIVSKEIILNATLVMLEMSAALLSLLFVFFLSQREGRAFFSSPLMQIASGIGVLIIFLTKYSLVFFFPALILALLSRHDKEIPAWARWRSAIIPSLVFLFLSSVWFWLLYDRHSFFDFFTEHPSNAPLFSAENLLFYPKAWLADYSPSALWGLVLLGLAGYAAKQNWHRLPVRMASWSTLGAFVILTLSTTNEVRHILPVVPLVFVLAGIGMSSLTLWARRTLKQVVFIPVILILILGSIALGASEFFLEINEELADNFEGNPASRQIEDFILNHVDFRQPVALYGAFNDQRQLSAIRWRAGVATERSLWDLHIDLIPLDLREDRLDLYNRKLQLSDENPNKLRSPLLRIIRSGYYAFLVEIYDLEKGVFTPLDETDPLIGPLISDSLTASEQIGDWQVNIYAFSE